VVAAHPDDEVLGCGATIAKVCASGAAVRVLFLADGVTARHDLSDHGTVAVKAKIKARKENAARALSILGASSESIYFGDGPACRLDQVYLIDLVKTIEKHIREFRPSRLYTHWGHDANIDHCLVHRAVMAATRPLDIPFLRDIYAFEVLSSTEWNTTTAFLANTFQSISGFLDRKLEAMNAYGEEMREAPHPRSAEVIRALAKFRGAQAGVAYAEGFSLIRLCEI
jgi:LmbE family N-acetylglucosaminyl deacetylase